MNNILLINKYFYKKGGAETSFFNTAELLKNKDHNIAFFSMKHPENLYSEYDKYFVSNIDYFSSQSSWLKIKNSLKLLYSFEAKRNINRLLKKEKIDIAHLHNIYHQLSPSILPELKKNNIPIVMTLHDYKLICGSYSMLSNGEICESCKNGKYCQILKNKCKGSFSNSVLLTLEMYLHHKILHIYDNVDLFISPSKFLIDKFKEMGFKKEICYLPNFVDLTYYQPNFNWDEESVVFFGRISKEKGIDTLIEAFKDIKNVSLKIIGDGPEKKSLEEKVRMQNIKNIFFLGYKKGEELYKEIKKSMFIVIPSEWYENNPFSVIEAFALGKPVIGSNIGGIPELVKDNITGFTFKSGNILDLKDKINFLLSNKNIISTLGKNARNFVEKELGQEKHYNSLINYYQKLLENQ